LTAPHGNSSSHSQQPGTTVAYSFSAYINETGNASDDVFPGTLPVTVNRSGDWLATTLANTSEDHERHAYGWYQHQRESVKAGPKGPAFCVAP
jgi:hypothetical protein